MSVTGFRIDGSIHKYDYNALDNKPGDGLTEAAKSALLQLARKVAYIDEHGEDYYQNLYNSFYGNFVNVINFLTGCYSSNIASTTKEGAAYTATIYANPGYSLTGATVNITMGGTDVTGAYSNGVINIPNVTGDLVITVVAASAVSISAVYTQSGTVYDTDTLDLLKADLVVTANYSDGSTQTVPATDYTLSGTLTAGTSTITVSYGDKTTTFNVVVTERLPAGYKYVEYIYSPASTGSSGPIVDTGIRLSGVGNAIIDISFMDYSTANSYPIGCLGSTTQNNIGFGVSIRNDSSQDVIAFTGGTPASISPVPLNNVRHDITAVVNSSGIQITNGTLTNTQILTPRAYNVANVYLFGIKKESGTGISYPFNGRIYYAKITENDVVLAEFIPCVRLSDHMAGFWDLVNETFIYANELVAAPFENDTTAQIEQFDVVLIKQNDEPQYTTLGSSGCGVTKLYNMDGGASSVLYPAGIIPARSVGTIRPQSKPASIVIYDENDNPITYVAIIDGYAFSRWAQDPNGTMTEFSQSWNTSPYSKIAFSIDAHYIHDAYMYDKTTGQVFFAGRNTPYYGMSNISEAQ